MFAAARQAVIERIAAAEILTHPFPHIYVEDVFPADFYAEIERHRLDGDAYRPLTSTGRVTGDAYRARLCLLDQDLAAASAADEKLTFWRNLFAAFNVPTFTSAWTALFGEIIRQRFSAEFPGASRIAMSGEFMLMRDLPAFALGPHTDSPLKVVSVLFYLPRDPSQAHLGTSLYLPKEQGFACLGGPHHPFDRFVRVGTMEYRPNALFAFPKTSASFHGVEPISNESVHRDLLLYDIKARVTS